jgi:hypothetical protein
MIRRFLSIFRRPHVDTIIARRAVRVCNRDPQAVARYEAVHRALARGRH